MSTSPVVIAIGHAFPDLAIENEVLAEQGVEVVNGNDAAERAAWADRATGVLLGTSTRFGPDLIQELPNCRALVRYGIGVDNVDLEAAGRADIAVCNVRDYCQEEVADHALAMALSLTRGLHWWDAQVRAGRWRGGERPSLGRSSSQTFGLVGFGQIGRILASKAARVFGTVLVHDAVAPEAPDGLDPNISFVDDLDGLLSASNVVSVHVPLTPETRDLIAADAIGRMPPGGCIINVSRGGIVNEEAVLAAIESGQLAGAGFDTFVDEPVPADHPLLNEPRVVLSPHVAWLSREAAIELRQRAAEEMARLLGGQQPVSAIVTS